MRRGFSCLAAIALCLLLLAGCRELHTVTIRIDDPETGRLNTLFDAGQRIGKYIAEHNPGAVVEIEAVLRDAISRDKTGKPICQSYLIRVARAAGRRLHDPPIKNAVAELDWLIRAESRAEIFALTYQRYTLAFLAGTRRGLQSIKHR